MLFRVRQGEMKTPLAGNRESVVQTHGRRHGVRSVRLVEWSKRNRRAHMIVDLHRNDIWPAWRLRHGESSVSLMILRALRVIVGRHISSEIVGIMGEESRPMFLRWASTSQQELWRAATKKIERWRVIDEFGKDDGRGGPSVARLASSLLMAHCTILRIPIRTVFLPGNKATCKPVAVTVYDFQCEDEYEEIQRKNSLCNQACV